MHESADWRRMTLAEVADDAPNSFVDGPFGSNLKAFEYSSEGVRLIQLQNIGDGFWIDENRKFIPFHKFEELRRHAAYPGDIAIAKMADPVARACLIPEVGDTFVVVADCIRLSPNRKRNDPRYLVYAINHRDARLQAELKSTGTTRQRINLSTLKTINIWVPPLSEQRAIADILETVDAAIQHTEAIIAKLKQIKAGLLHDLLTRGQDEHGQLRDPVAHPEQFKESPVGHFPRDWSVHRLDTLAEIGSGVTLGRDLGDVGTVELPYLRVANVQDGYVNLTEIKTIRVREQEVEKYLLQPGDVLMTEGGDFDKLGRGTVWYGEISPCLHQNHIFRVRADSHRLRPEFLAALAMSVYGKRYFLLSSKQSTNLASINSTQLKAFPVLTPTREEQDRILDALDVHDSRIHAEEASLDKLRLLKKGLMDDLLTGRVRVTALAEGG